MTLKSYARFEEKLTSGLENDMWNLANFHQNIESLKICTLWGSFIRSRKCMSLKFTGELWVMSYDNAEWCKTWKGIDLSVQNWHEEFNKFSLSNSSQKSKFFVVLMYDRYGHSRYFKLEWKYQQYSPCFEIIFPFLMTMI